MKNTGVASFTTIALLAVPGCFELPPDYDTKYECTTGVCGDGFKCVEKRCIREDRQAVYLEEQDEPLFDFPVLVSRPWSSPAGNAGVAENLAFLDADGKVLAHEIEFVGDDVIVAWVLVPHIKDRRTGGKIGEQTFIQIRDGQRPEDKPLWNDSYASVYHFADADEDAGARPWRSLAMEEEVRDSTGQGRNGVVTGNSYPLSGRDARRTARAFAGDAAIEITAPPLDAYTISGWFKPSTAHTSAMASRPGAFWVGSSVGSYAVRVHAEGATRELKGSPVKLDIWTHLAITVTRTNVILYVDGKHVACSHYGDIAQSVAPIYLGASRAADALDPKRDFLHGALDEVRIETVARSEAWIRAEVLSQAARMALVGLTTPIL